MTKPDWLKDEPTRKKSAKQEGKLAKKFGGKLTSNSGARFGENDVITPDYEIEAKKTDAMSYTMKIKELRKMQAKCSNDKVAIEIVEFGNGESYVIINLNDFRL